MDEDNVKKVEIIQFTLQMVLLSIMAPRAISVSCEDFPYNVILLLMLSTEGALFHFFRV